jgi:hypothetical protein
MGMPRTWETVLDLADKPGFAPRLVQGIPFSQGENNFRNITVCPSD